MACYMGCRGCCAKLRWLIFIISLLAATGERCGGHRGRRDTGTGTRAPMSPRDAAARKAWHVMHHTPVAPGAVLRACGDPTKSPALLPRAAALLIAGLIKTVPE